VKIAELPWLTKRKNSLGQWTVPCRAFNLGVARIEKYFQLPKTFHRLRFGVYDSDAASRYPFVVSRCLEKCCLALRDQDGEVALIIEREAVPPRVWKLEIGATIYVECEYK